VNEKQFDDLANRLSVNLNRRRGLGLLGLAGITSFGLVDEAVAKRKKKKKKKGKKKNPPTTAPPTTPPTTPDPRCAACSTCETCVNGECRRKADGTSCGPGAICAQGSCATSCTVSGNQCPNDQSIFCPGVAQPQVCIDIADICEASVCTTSVDCPTGKICVYAGSICEDENRRCVDVVLV
jgi:hypothetical protein